MAKAPKPGGEQAPSRVAFKFTVRDETWLVPPPAYLPIKEKIAVRYATGLPYESFIPLGEGAVGEDTLVVLYWLGRRGDGEMNLGFNRAVEDWKLLDVQGGDVNLEFVDIADGDSPEASGPDT